MPLLLMSEPYSPAGSMAASTLTRAVRNTSLDEWSILLRETLQNSVDARLNSVKAVHFQVTIDYATVTQRSVLQKEVFAEAAYKVDLLQKVLKRPQLPLLTITDWETRGLGGPTRADTDTTERTDFRDFFLNVGREKEFKGGTYGLGRGALFDISEPGAIVVYTRIASGGNPVTRLMAMAIGPGYARNGLKYTGRHWWGAKTDSARPEPIVNTRADRVAKALGLDLIPDGKTGTAIMVIAPRIPEEATLKMVLDEMSTAARLYGWPLMIGRSGRPAVSFEFGRDGQYWVPEAPDTQDSPVRRFVEAYRLAEKAEPPEAPTSWKHQAITFGAGRAVPQPLGTLVFRHFPPTDGADSGEDDDWSGIPHCSIALMRDPRMVVRYLPVAKHPMGSSTVGVFIADNTFDKDFAESEPVAHDDWIPAKLATGRFARNPVKQALDKVKQAVKDSWQTRAQQSVHGGGVDGIAPVIGDLLGGMVADTPGFGGRRVGPPPRPSKPGVRFTRASVETPVLRAAKGGGVLAVFPVTLHRIGERSPLILTARPRVVLDSGLEQDNDRPAGASPPAVVGWEDPASGDSLADGETHEVPPDVDSLLVVVDQPRDTAVTVEIEIEQLAS